MHVDAFDEFVRLVIVAILGIFTFFFRRLIRDLDATKHDLQIHNDDNRADFKELGRKVQDLDKKVAIFTDRDRLRRLEDYYGRDTNDTP